MELSETGRPKRKGRQDISYKLFFSDSIDEEDLQELSGKHNERFNVAFCIFTMQVFQRHENTEFQKVFFFSDKLSVLLFLIVSDSCLSEEGKGKCHWV